VGGREEGKVVCIARTDLHRLLVHHTDPGGPGRNTVWHGPSSAAVRFTFLVPLVLAVGAREYRRAPPSVRPRRPIVGRRRNREGTFGARCRFPGGRGPPGVYCAGVCKWSRRSGPTFGMSFGAVSPGATPTGGACCDCCKRSAPARDSTTRACDIGVFEKLRRFCRRRCCP